MDRAWLRPVAEDDDIAKALVIGALAAVAAVGMIIALTGGADYTDGREVFPVASRPEEVPSPGRTGSGGVLASRPPCHEAELRAPECAAPEPSVGGVYCAGAPGLDWEWVDGGVLTYVTCGGVRVVSWAFTPSPPAERAPVASEPPVEVVYGRATHYGESYQGQTMGCGGTYDTADPTIVAVSPDRYESWPCGTRLRVTGPAGTVDVIRTDSCPGCSGNWLDLSEAGHARVCGLGTCDVTIEVLR